jgi:hypothetical protein
MEFKAANEGSGLSNEGVVRLKDKESVTGVLRGTPYEYRQHWVGNSSILCDGLGKCKVCDEGGNKPQFKFRVNIVASENGSGMVAKIFESGWMVYKQLKSLQDAGYTLEKTVIKIARAGSGLNDTTYSVVPVPGVAWSAKLESQVSLVELKDLAPKHEEPVVGDTPSPVPPMTETDVPF